MSNFFKSKYKLIAVLLVLMLVVTGISIKVAQSQTGLPVILPTTSEEESPEEDETDPTEIEEDDEPEVVEINHRSPDVMRGVFLTPGVDFLTSEEDDAKTIKEQVEKAVVSARDLTLNSIIINTEYGEEVIYKTAKAPAVSSEVDVMSEVVSAAKNEGMFVYALFDVSDYATSSGTISMALGSGDFNALAENIGEFAEKYELDGILLSGYQNETKEESYGIYSKIGGAIGFNNYMRLRPEAIVRSCAAAIRKSSPDTMVGILADPVWANAETNELGSKTSSKYTSLESANADTRGFIEKKLVDFVIVNAYGSTTNQSIPFGEVVSWWSEVAHKEDIPLYVMQSASLAGSSEPGWGGADELVKQAVMLDEATGIRGNAFDSLSKLTSGAKSTENLFKYYKEDIEPELLLSQLEMTKPAETTYTTNETQVVFTGASDPTEKVMINGNVVPTDQSGYFTITYELKPGLNEFQIAHKDKTVEYKITRQVNILTEIGPVGSITADGGMEITIVATAYDGAKVTASIGGATISLAVDDNVVDESNRDSTYKRYTGVYKAPAATSSTQNLGAITVTANWQGESKSLTGATVTVNKKAKIEDGVPVVIVADQARTYPGTTLDNIPKADCYPLPKGAMDYAVGEEIMYKEVSYTVLASGLRVKTEDISVSSDYASGNAISSISVDSKDGYTYVTLDTAQQVSYNFGYSGGGVSIDFNYTNSVPQDVTLSKNPLFVSAQWSGTTLNLNFVKQNGFMGYKAYYNDGGNLVFRFNNTPSSISGARIVIDPGHGGKDTGALGFLVEYPEKAINKAIAEILADELESRGATVLMLDTSAGMDLPTRVAKAENFNAHFYVSVHNNTAPNAAAKGTEVYYFYPYSKQLAASSASAVSSQLGTANRGGKQSYYHVTLSSQFQSVLVECGFMSNRDEYEKLIRTKYQERIAVGIADGIASAVNSAYTGVSGSGSENSGGSVEVEGENVKPPEQNVVADGISLNRSTLSLREGRTAVIKATVTPSSAGKTVKWSSSDESVATVTSTGTVTAISAGKATITAKSEAGKTAGCAVTVTASGANTDNNTGGKVPVEEVIISDSSISLAIDGSYQLDAGVYPAHATNTKVTWSSSSLATATVSDKGLVKAVAKGTATITVTTDDGKYTDVCTVIVDGGSTEGDANALKDANYIEIFEPETLMSVKTTQRLVVKTDKGKVVPNNLITWTSSDKGIATVDNNGVVTAKSKEGKVSIDVETKDGTLYDYVSIEVIKGSTNTVVDSIKINHSEISIAKGVTFKDIDITLSPSSAKYTDLDWRIISTKVATVNAKGEITGVKTGNTTLVVKAKRGKAEDSCRIVVNDADKIKIYDIYLDDDFEMFKGDKDTVRYTTDPSGTTAGIVWKSSMPSVVSVDSKGNVEALRKGTVTITASSASDPDVYDTCQITVFD